MKLTFHLGLLATVCGMAASEPMLNMAAQTFYVPLPEETLYQETFLKINKEVAKQPVNTMISIVVSTDDTLVYYDHWEDGFDPSPTVPERITTEVWGDGNAANGCPRLARFKDPTDSSKYLPCTDAMDKLKAGDSMILESVVPALVNRTKTANGNFEPIYDGGDRITATLPVAVVRGSFPAEPGSLMAGGVEVLDTDNWGTSFVSPAGPDGDLITKAFEYTGIYIMAKDADTKVQKNSETPVTLQQGESVHFLTKVGDKIISDKPVQADLLTGDISSTYELRWFSLMETSRWSSKYITPMGDSVGLTKVYCYNDNPTSITINYDYLASGTKKTGTLSLDSKKGDVTATIPTGSSSYVYSDKPFIALSMTDFVTEPRGWNGQIYDWGFPLMPLEMLTDQVIIGLGFGCSFNRCWAENKDTERSVVFIGAMEDAWIHVDFDNDGTDDKLVFQKALESALYVDTKYNDRDMSGALIYATKNKERESDAVPIAAAWGQNPAFSGTGDDSAMDLGTVVVPFSSLRVKKYMSLYTDVDKNLKYNKGDVVEFLIEVMNVGQVDVAANSVTVFDTEKVNWEYVPGSFVYEVEGGGTIQVADDVTGTPFPLDDAGLKNPAFISKRGGKHKLRFLAKIPYAAEGEIVRNAGYLKQPLRPNLPFEVEEPLSSPQIWPRTSGGSCMYDNWKDHGKTTALTCTAKEVWIDEAFAEQAKACEVGKPIKLTLNAKVHFNGDTFDPGWYIATDGGDAMEGNCALAALEESYAGGMRLTMSADSNLLADDAAVQWQGDVGNDECGDVVKVPGGGAVLDYTIAVATELICADSTGDGKMDFNICFSWRKPADDQVCGISEQMSLGMAPDLYPGDENSCFCATVKIPNVIAMNPGDRTFPC